MRWLICLTLSLHNLQDFDEKAYILEKLSIRIIPWMIYHQSNTRWKINLEQMNVCLNFDRTPQV